MLLCNNLSSFVASVVLFFVFAGTPVFAQVSVPIDIEMAPFHYTQTSADNRVSRLVEAMKAKEVHLKYTEERGYLGSLVEALEISESSQVLVFSKTSMQVNHISRRNPRAIYFNDDTYVGWVNGSSLAEISTHDPKLGTAFYTVDMMPWRAKIVRADYDCLGCHATSMTQGVPGHTVRSVMPSFDGTVNAQSESFITSDSSPISQRWGGWYVTGLHGEMRHMGNAILRGSRLDTADNGNRMNLRDEFDTTNYLSPYSDIVALMILEHQTQVHNAFTKADFFIRQIQHDASELDSTPEREAEMNAQLGMIAKEVVDRLLFVGEASLTDEVRGSVVFRESFIGRGPKDSKGRCLRNLDLRERMFEYPCSYLIYSSAFDALTPCLREEILRQIHDVLTSEHPSKHYSHLTTETRSDILEILLETKLNLPASWR